MNLLVDIGNSRLKWGWERDGVIVCREALDYRRCDMIYELRRAWRGLAPPLKLAIASVAATQIADEISSLAVSIWPAIEFVMPRSSEMAFGVSNAYRHPDKLGVDRWLAMLAAHRHYPERCCIADCGTAITVDVVDAGGRHLGGVISAGLWSMKKALAADTEALAFSPVSHGVLLADNTVSAIDSGTLLAAAGLIESVVRRQGQPCLLILTGGDADAVANALETSAIVDPDLVLKGLSLCCEGEDGA